MRREFYLFDGGWPNVAWADLLSMAGGSYSADLIASYLRTPAAFFRAPIGTTCFAVGLPIFLLGLVRYGDVGARKPA